jgi:hypothetical protein
LLLAGCASAPPADGIDFGVLGDTPYSAREVERLDQVIDAINARDLAFVVHVGDIGSSAPDEACGDAWLEARKRQFSRIRHRFILVPGDNEWSDCRNPLVRLERWRQIFCEEPSAYCEHQRWESGGWIFATLNVPGNNNNLGQPEHTARMARVLSDLRASALQAEKRDGLVIFFQANPFDTVRRSGYGELVEELAALGRRMPGRAIVVHGDTHLYKDDEPLPGLRRVETWGSPFVRWLRLSLPASPAPSPR